ncbi:MAG: GHKL domain-containing protein [Alistipes sp.]|nr:GHKL domain-containing protein [Alistipes sp.]
MSDNILRIICSLFTASVSYFCFIRLCDKIYEIQKGVLKKTATCAAVIVIMQFVHLFQNSYLNFLYTILSSQILCSLLYKASLKKSLLKNIYYRIASTFGEIISVALVGTVTENKPSEVMSDFRLMFASCLMYVLIVFFAYRIFSIIWSSREIISLRMKELGFIIFLTAFEFFVLYCFTRTTSSLNCNVLIITVAGFLILDIYAACIVNAVAAGYKSKYELDAIKMQSEIQFAHYEELNNKYVETQCMVHDIEKHISAIEKLSKNRDFSEAEEYTAKLRAELKRHRNIFECSNRILSAVMSQKISLAESKGITVETKIEDMLLDFMDETDITSIFANLMDNAIEACDQTDNQKHISVKMCRLNDFLYIDMMNSFSGKTIQQNGKFKSTKAGHKGYGMTSIQMAIEKYDGYMVTEQKDNIFISEIVIPLV